MEVKIKHNAPDCYFAAEIEGERAGVMTYRNVTPDVIVINHTEVEPRFENRGIGKEMIVACALWARENGKRVVPQCSFARAVFARKKELADVVYDI